MTNTIFYQKLSLKFWLLLAVFFSMALCLSPASAAPSPDLWPRWQAHVAGDTGVVNHSLWDKLLKKYLVTNHPSGINRFRYGDVSPEDRKSLTEYLRYLQQIREMVRRTENDGR